HVLVVHVDIDEPVEATVVGHDVLRDPRVSGFQVGQEVTERPALGVHQRLPAGMLAQDGRELHANRHWGVTPSSFTTRWSTRRARPRAGPPRARDRRTPRSRLARCWPG